MIRASANEIGTAHGEFTVPLPGGGVLRLGGKCRTLVMGVLNVTPDSFSDGGRYFEPEAAIAQGERLIEEGADIVDVGGESTRSGSESVDALEQIRRVTPVIESLARRFRTPISVDTTRASVAERALDAGAQIVNDVTALQGDPALASLLTRRGAPVVLMHMLGTPRTMQFNPVYGDVVEDVAAFLAERMRAAEQAGISCDRMIVDPGFGFGKTLEHNLELLRRLAEFGRLGRPVLVGTSRKAMLGKILDAPPAQRVYGTCATVAAAVERGACIVRVHDVKAAADVVKVMAALFGSER